MLRPRALIFDMDGLMVDSEPLWCAIEADFCRARGGEWTDELARACVGQGLANTIRVMHEQLGFEVDVVRDTDWIVDAFVARTGTLKLKAGCQELVDAASGRLPIAVGSSSARRLILAVLDRFGLTARFGAIVSGECVARPKPAPDIFLKAAHDLGVSPEGCVVLEDSLAGVMAARAAGMQVIAVPEALPEAFRAIADRVAADLHEARENLTF